MVIQDFINGSLLHERLMNVPVLMIIYLLLKLFPILRSTFQPITLYGAVVCKLPAVQPSLKERKRGGGCGTGVGWIFSLERQ